MCGNSNHNINMDDNKIAMITRPLPTILIQISTEGRVSLSNVVGDILILIDKTGQEFLGNNYIVVTRNNLQVLFFEVEDELKIGLTNNNLKVI